MVGPLVVDADGAVQRVCARSLPTLTQALVYALYLHRLPYIGARLAQRLMSPYDLADAQEVGAISGAAMFARRSVIEEIGGFDEVFLHTAEGACRSLPTAQTARRTNLLLAAGPHRALRWPKRCARARACGDDGVYQHAGYFRRSGGRASALAYRLIVQVIQMPLLLLVGVGKALLLAGFRRTAQAFQVRSGDLALAGRRLGSMPGGPRAVSGRRPADDDLVDRQDPFSCALAGCGSRPLAKLRSLADAEGF